MNLALQDILIHLPDIYFMNMRLNLLIFFVKINELYLIHQNFSIFIRYNFYSILIRNYQKIDRQFIKFFILQILFY